MISYHVQQLTLLFLVLPCFFLGPSLSNSVSAALCWSLPLKQRMEDKLIDKLKNKIYILYFILIYKYLYINILDTFLFSSFVLVYHHLSVCVQMKTSHHLQPNFVC